MPVNPSAAAGFNAATGAYDRGRPSYPDDALAWMCDQAGVRRGALLLDLGAGTGKMTALLAGRGARVVACEPVASMRHALHASLPGVPVVASTAESLPFASATFDAMVAAQAFHWFEAPIALAEIARVLRPGGGLALVWNERDESVPWVAELTRVIRWDVCMPYQVGTDWRETLDASDRFTPAARARFAHVQTMDADLLVDRVLSTSYIAAMAPDEQQAIAVRVRALAAPLGDRFDLPYVTEAFACRRR